MGERPIDWRGSSYKDFCEMPHAVQRTFGHALGLAQNNLPLEGAKTLTSFKPTLIELLEDDDGDTYRAVYTAHYRDVIRAALLQEEVDAGPGPAEAGQANPRKSAGGGETDRSGESAKNDERAVMDGHITPAGTSVLDDLPLDPAFVVKAKLAIRIQKSIAEMDLTQREAAARMGITQPKLSLIARGKLDDISQAKLETCLRALGHDIEIAVGPRHDGVGEITVRDAA